MWRRSWTRIGSTLTFYGEWPRAIGGTGSLARESSAVAGANVRRRGVAARQLLGGTPHERAGLLDCLPFHLNRIRPCRRLVTVRRSENLVQRWAAFLDASHCRRPAVGAHPDRLAAPRRGGRRGGLAGRRRSKPIGTGSIPVACSHPRRPRSPRVSVFVEVMGFGTRPGHARRREQPCEQPPCRASRCSGGSPLTLPPRWDTIF